MFKSYSCCTMPSDKNTSASCRTRNRIIKGAIFAAVAVVIFVATMILNTALAFTELRTLKVGFYAFDGFNMMDEEGQPSGYDYEYLAHLALFGNWTYDYVGYDKSWSDMLTMLDNGEIDFTSGVLRTPDRMEKYDFTDIPVGYTSTVVNVKAGDMRFSTTNYESWDGIRVGFLVDSASIDNFELFAWTKGFTFTALYYNDLDALSAALQSGEEVDAIVESTLRASHNEHTIAVFDTSPYYMITRKGDPLIKELNEALTKLYKSGDDFEETLSDKYYGVDEQGDIAYSDEEYAYIEEMSGTVFKAVLNPDRMPLSAYKNGGQQE